MIDLIHRYVLSSSTFGMQKRYPKRCFSIPQTIPEIVYYRDRNAPYPGSPNTTFRQIARAIGLLISSIGRGACALWSLSAGAAARCRCQMCGRVRVGAWVLVSLYWCCLFLSSALCETMGTLKNDTMTLPHIMSFVIVAHISATRPDT